VLNDIYLKPYTLIVQTLSPLHVGAGFKLGKADYVLHNGRFYVIDENKLMTWIAQQPDAEKLAFALADNLRDMGKGIGDFIRNNLRDRCKLSEITAYSLPYTGSPKDVFAFIKTSESLPYLPGSSIKGVLRSALLRGAMIQDVDLKQKAQKFIHEGAKLPKPKTNSDQIQAELFAPTAPKISKIPNYDINRLLVVRDSTPLDRNSLQVVQIKVLSVDRQKGLKWKQKPAKGTMADMDVYVEAIPTSVVLTHPVIWQTNLLREQAQLLGFASLEHLMAFLPEYCRRVSLNLLTQELDFYQRHGHKELEDWFEKRLTSLAKSSETIFILPMGWGSGYDAKTITDLLEEETFKLVVSKHKNTQGLGKPGRNPEEHWLGPGDSPKSRKLVVHSDGTLEPLGWVAMRFVLEKGAEDWIKSRRKTLIQRKPVIQPKPSLTSATPVTHQQSEAAASPSPAPTKPQASAPAPQPGKPAAPRPKPAEKPLIASFKDIPKPGDRFRGLVFSDYKGEVWLEIPGLNPDEQAYAVLLRSENPLLGKVKEGQSLECEAVAAEEESPGYWRVKCRFS
jgi:CRISPR type III-A-associated RAMP protein Csm5